MKRLITDCWLAPSPLRSPKRALNGRSAEDDPLVSQKIAASASAVSRLLLMLPPEALETKGTSESITKSRRKL